jgi:hypothetical protein
MPVRRLQNLLEPGFPTSKRDLRSPLQITRAALLAD